MKLTKYSHAIIFFSLIQLAFQRIMEIVQKCLSLICHRIFVRVLNSSQRFFSDKKRIILTGFLQHL